MKDLLKEAIADAKAVRETALANAKLALEEAFTPRLQSIISSQLQNENEEMGDEDHDSEEHEMAEDAAVGGEDTTPEVSDDMDADHSEETSDDDDMDLDEVIRELEGEDDEMDEDVDTSGIGTGDNKKPSKYAHDTADAGDIDLFEMDDEDTDEDEDVDLDEVIKSLREDDEDDAEYADAKFDGVEDKDEEQGEPADHMADVEKMEDDLEEAYNVIRFLKDKINEVNLLNAKLLYSNKLFKSYDLSEGQKMKVIENFDRAVSLREVKLVFSTLAESFKSPIAKKMVKESFASKPVASTKPASKSVLTEGAELSARFQKLAGIIK